MATSTVGAAQQESRSADPTVLTTEALLRATEELRRAIHAERDYVDGQVAIVNERLKGIDVATVLRVETGHTAQAGTDEKIEHLTGLMTERFTSVAIQFKERDTRSERESRDNKVAVDAAFAAQKEAAAKQDEANQKAIDKSERATAETITKLSELFKSTTDALADKIDDVKSRQSSMESDVNGIRQNKAGGTDTKAALYVVAGIVVAAMGVALGFVNR